MASSLEALGQLALRQAQHERAARLYGAAHQLRTEINAPLPPAEREDYARSLQTLSTRLGEVGFAAAWESGRALALAQVLATELHQQVTPPAMTAPAASAATAARPHYPAQLTVREVEVLRLVAQGLSDAEVANKLVVSRCIVNAHLSSIYGKLGVSSRTAATRFAIEHQFV